MRQSISENDGVGIVPSREQDDTLSKTWWRAQHTTSTRAAVVIWVTSLSERRHHSLFSRYRIAKLMILLSHARLLIAYSNKHIKVRLLELAEW